MSHIPLPTDAAGNVKMAEQNPESTQYIYNEVYRNLAVSTAPGAVDTNVFYHDGMSDLILGAHMLGGEQVGPADATVSLIVYGSIGMDTSAATAGAGAEYVDVTKRFLDCNANTSSSATYSATGTSGVTYLLEWPRCPLKRLYFTYEWDAAPSVTNGEIILGYRHKAL